ncbi:MAG TPA: hypothetical protein VFN03_02585 [Trueperaceae bacterium]|nr:hypothetical protein [Trueperaceae bacterium]
MADTSPALAQALESAARLQEIVPDAVLVGGAAAALHASHCDSFAHDHVLADLSERFDVVLEAIESTDGWVTNRVVPRKIILGELGDIEAGVRQMIRRRPLETIEVQLPSGRTLRAPSVNETLRVKAYLIVSRNQTRDYLDVAALSEQVGPQVAARILSGIDDYYADQHGHGAGVASQVARQLADPLPKDARTTRELHRYKRLAPRWHDWRDVVAACREVALSMVVGGVDQEVTEEGAT